MGFIIKYNPNLIAGYNTMPEKKRQNIDINALSAFIRNSLIVIGLLIIAGYYLLFYIGFTNIAEYIPLFTILTGVVFILVRAQRFDKSNN